MAISVPSHQASGFAPLLAGPAGHGEKVTGLSEKVVSRIVKQKKHSKSSGTISCAVREGPSVFAAFPHAGRQTPSPLTFVQLLAR
uniref:Uncharacterized protein n=1 Tax=uncultured bacterium Contig1777 TaxID=1393514 RepID=W0FQN1_9BACT|nr:hypothetical protein [uncultured bacterium Contig1777]